MKWIDDKHGEQLESWLDVVLDDGSLGEDGEAWWKATVKWDGCIHLNRYHNLPYPQPKDDRHALSDYLHICELDEFIEAMIALRDRAKEYFGAWPG
jgi:hypothetical protein